MILCLLILHAASVACTGQGNADGAAGLTIGGKPHSAPPQTRTRDVVVNRVTLDAETLAALEGRYRVVIAGGAYWYDARSSLCGGEGRPPLGLFAPNLAIGGPLREDASNGSTNVFVNGRNITDVEVAYLQRFIVVEQGRYWLDADGSVGFEGSTDILFNLFAVIRSSQSSGGGAGGSFYSNSLIDSASNSSGGCSYISVDGTTYTSGCG